MNELEANKTPQESKIEYSFSLTDKEIKAGQTKRIVARVGAGFLFLALLYGGYLIWKAPIAPVNKFGIMALLAFLAFYLGRFIFTSEAGPVAEVNILIIDEDGIALNNTFVEWDLIDKVEVKNRRDGKYLVIDIQYKREAYTAPVQNYLFIWQVERFGDVGEILARINRRLHKAE